MSKFNHFDPEATIPATKRRCFLTCVRPLTRARIFSRGFVMTTSLLVVLLSLIGIVSGVSVFVLICIAVLIFVAISLISGGIVALIQRWYKPIWRWFRRIVRGEH